MSRQLSTSRNEHMGRGSSSSKKLLIVEDDRLSMLPHEIQCKILSFLPTTDAAKVGLLSRMWRSTQCSLFKLTFDYYQFPEMETKLDMFVKFIDQTLAHHDESDVKTVELRLCPFVDNAPIKSEWITFAIHHNVRKLVLYGKFNDVEKLPDCVFSCQSLVKLELAVEELVLTLRKTFSHPSLRKLKLKYLVLSELVLSQDLLSCFPALEKLSIFFCTVQYSKVISLSSSKLTEFTMCSCLGMESCSIRLQAPHLSKFVYICNDSKASDLEIPPNVFQLVINGGGAYMSSSSTYDLSRSVIKVTKELFQNKHLRINHWLIEYLSMAHDLPRHMTSHLFHNLINLDVSLWPIMEHVKVLMLLLSRCPNLSVLSLDILPPQREAHHLPNMEFLADFDVGDGFHSLTHIWIENFAGDETELLLVRSLLAAASGLLLLRIVMNLFMVNSDMELKISKILGYEKSSPYADVIFD